MIIKPLSNKNADIKILTQLLDHPDACEKKKKDIKLQLKKIQSGIKGEKEAAYEIDFYFGKSKNWAVIHDLRIDFDGLQAQIDHMMIDRCLNIYLIESKHFASGIAINEHDEFVAFYGNKPIGIPSPIEQGKKHKRVIEHCINNGLFSLPKRIGMNIKPSIKNFILVSKNARVERNKNSKAEINNIIKADQFNTHINKISDSESFINNLKQLSKTVSRETLKQMAENIVMNHTPINFDWYARFDLKKDAITTSEGSPKAYSCHECGVEVEKKVFWYCTYNKDKYSGHIYCRNCQPLIVQRQQDKQALT